MASWDIAAISVGSSYEALMNETDSKGKSKYDRNSGFVALSRKYESDPDIPVISENKAKETTPAELAKIGVRDGRYVKPFQVG